MTAELVLIVAAAISFVVVSIVITRQKRRAERARELADRRARYQGPVD